MRNSHDLRTLNPGSSREGIFIDLLLGCTQTTSLGFGLTCSCPFPDEKDCIEEGKCKFLSAIDIVKPALVVEKQNVFLNAEHVIVSDIWRTAVLRRWIKEMEAPPDDKGFIKALLQEVGPLEILVAAYKYLEQDPNQISQLGYWAKSSFDSYLFQIAKKIKYSLNPEFEFFEAKSEGNFRLDTSFPVLQARIYTTHRQSSEIKSPQILNDETHESVIENSRISKRVSGHGQLTPQPSDAKRPKKRNWQVSWFPFDGFNDPLESGVDLPSFPIITKKELENGLQDYGDAAFYLRQMAFAEQVDQECLEMVLREIRIQNTSLEYSQLKARLRWIKSRHSHLASLIESLIQHLEKVLENSKSRGIKSSQELVDPFQGFCFPTSIESESLRLKPEIDRCRSGINYNPLRCLDSVFGGIQYPENDQVWSHWPYHVAVDPSNRDMAEIFISHGFNCTFIARLQHGTISDSEMKRIKELKALVILTGSRGSPRRYKQLDSRKFRSKWKKQLSLDGLQVVSGTMRSTLRECLEAKNLQPLKCGIRCLYDGMPLIEDQRLNCIPRKKCVLCRNAYSIEELEWISQRNRTLLESALWKTRPDGLISKD
eukprot:Gregarina_sp_Poly_1__828@NODE_1199_length_4801_cov_10_399662_g824_i0_p1_GENE_NODE_1199_length_4801_cov_10_399662_g824_i0NODE_1199_length_4801_cov_10_399662_g824_i0_p1_ORF_typecomplete_len598_score57_46Arif1/PF06770_11/0_21_NODE_1199_length_4801_cov_10_399662_g824_i016193412